MGRGLGRVQGVGCCCCLLRSNLALALFLTRVWVQVRLGVGVEKDAVKEVGDKGVEVQLRKIAILRTGVAYPGSRPQPS